MEIQYKGMLWKVKPFCDNETAPKFHFAPTKQKTKIQQSHLAVGKLGRKTSPVDCKIT